MRILTLKLAVLFVGAILVANIANAQTPASQVRTWKSTAGTQVTGSLVNQDEASVTLEIPGNPKPVKISLDRLSADDQKYVKVSVFEKQDREQFAQVKEHLRTVNEQPQTVSRLLLELHKAFPESPYAGLWASVTYCLGTNEHDRAKVVLEETIKRIKNQQALEPARHRMTLCSANNNLAICMIKERKGDSAATKMIEAINGADTIPTVVASNAKMFTELTTDKSAAITFTSNTRTKLLSAVALAKTAGRGTDLPRGWHFSLDFDVPTDSGASTKIEGIDAPRGGMQLLASGTGFVVAPGIVMTARPVVESTNYSGPKLVTVITKNDRGSARSELVQNLLIAATKSVAESATVASFSDGSSGVWTNYKYVRPDAGTVGAELSALLVPGLSIAPVEIAERDPDNSTELTILGYSRGNRMLADGIQEQTGRALITSGIPSSRALSTSARVLGGNRGGPVIDTKGVVIGIAFDTPPSGFEEQGLFFGAGELRRWFYRHVQTAQLNDVKWELPAAGRSAMAREATVPVLCWGLEQASDQQIFSQFADNSRASGGLYLRDGWCVACDGKGVVDCPVKGCSKGTVSYSEVVETGYDRVSQSMRTANVKKSRQCTECDGRGTRDCPHCKGGKI